MKLLTDFFPIKTPIINNSPKTSNQPTSQQLNAINANLDKNISIIACAGSGKTTTLINRIDFLIKNGIHPTSIILTTFTRDAAKDMSKKLNKKLGKENGVYVGTMDSLSLYFLRYYDELNENMQNVGEYAVNFLIFLRKSDKRKIFFSSKKYLIVDEFQDLNQLQFEIICEFYKNNIIIIGVGDDAQNIYTFRGSNVKYLINFGKYFPNSIQFMLTHNFRSTEEIITIANGSIEKALLCIPKKMISCYKGEKPEIRFFGNIQDQTDFIINKIFQLKKTFLLDEICILCPMNQMLFHLEESALKNNLPIHIIDNKGLETNSSKKGKVTMCTIHKSKGLEWDVVFIIGMNDELFPAEKDADKIEEARRLFYVATTRAKKYLFYTFTPVGGSRKVTRFIGEIPLQNVHFFGYCKEFVEQSKEEHILEKEGVMDRIENLQIEDISYLRRNNIIPSINENQLIINDIHLPIQLPKFVYEQNLLADFGIYLDCLVTRELAILYGKKLNNFACQCCLGHVRVDPVVYKLYKDNRELVRGMLGGRVECVDVRLVQLVERIRRSGKKNKIRLEDVVVHPTSFLSKDWMEKLEKSYGNFTNCEIRSSDILEDIWNVSLCGQIISNGRRKMLYIGVPMDKVKEFGENIINRLIYFKQEKGEIIIHKHYGVEGLNGEIDFWKDGALYDIKMSHEKKIDLNWILQLMCYKGMMDVEVNKFFIYNALLGKVVEIPVVEMEKCLSLVEYVRVKFDQSYFF